MRRLLREILKTTILVVSLFVIVPPAFAAEHEWSEVGKAMGKEGKLYPGNIYKISLIRDDLNFSIDGIQLKSAILRGSWVAFQKMEDHAMAMADLALTHEEVRAVTEKLEESGFEITGLHNHELRLKPAMMYLHAMGYGDPVKLAQALREAIKRSGTPFKASQEHSFPVRFSQDSIDNIMGIVSSRVGGVLKYHFSRADEIKDNGIVMEPAFGPETGIDIQPLDNKNAAAVGDIGVIASEVQPVVNALRERGMELTALHNHMVTEKPRLLFVHFWVHGEAEKVASDIRFVLDKVNLKGKPRG